MDTLIVKKEVRRKVNGKGFQFSKEFITEFNTLVSRVLETCITNVGLEGRKRLSGEDVKIFNDWLEVKAEVKAPVITPAEQVKETIALVNETNKEAKA